MRYVKIISQLIISVVIFFILLSKVDFIALEKVFKKVDLFAIFIAILLFIFQLILVSLRWKIILMLEGFKLSYSKILNIVWTGSLFNQVLPSSVGGDLIRGYYLKKSGLSISDSISQVILDRFFGLVGLVVLCFISTYALSDLIADRQVINSMKFISLGLLAVMGLFIFIQISNRFRTNKVGRLLFNVLSSVKNCIKSKKGLKILLISVFIHIISVKSFHLIAVSINDNITFSSLLLIIPFVYLIIALPISFAGWGAREGSLIFGLSLFNISIEESLAISIILGLIIIVSSLPGFISWHLIRNKYD